MNRRKFVKLSSFGLASLALPICTALAQKVNGEGMSLVTVDFPSPRELRGGWAALASVFAARGWANDVYATESQWVYHDGGGNWICLRSPSKHRAIFVGHDHEYSETYYGEAAKYFGEKETDILLGAPEWWRFDLSPLPFSDWIGFVYGWDGEVWQRSNYAVADGFESVDLKSACSMNGLDVLRSFAEDAPGLDGKTPSDNALRALVDADAKITKTLLEQVIPGWDLDAGVLAAEKFLELDV